MGSLPNLRAKNIQGADSSHQISISPPHCLEYQGSKRPVPTALPLLTLRRASSASATASTSRSPGCAPPLPGSPRAPARAQVLVLDLVEREVAADVGRARAARADDAPRQRLRADARARGDDGGALDGVAQLAHVARPRRGRAAAASASGVSSAPATASPRQARRRTAHEEGEEARAPAARCPRAARATAAPAARRC